MKPRKSGFNLEWPLLLDAAQIRPPTRHPLPAWVIDNAVRFRSFVILRIAVDIRLWQA